jgi:hypothetical protein
MLPVWKDKQVELHQNPFYVHDLPVMYLEATNICISITVNVSKPKQVNKFESF